MTLFCGVDLWNIWTADYWILTSFIIGEFSHQRQNRNKVIKLSQEVSAPFSESLKLHIILVMRVSVSLLCSVSSCLRTAKTISHSLPRQWLFVQVGPNLLCAHRLRILKYVYCWSVFKRITHHRHYLLILRANFNYNDLRSYTLQYITISSD